QVPSRSDVTPRSRGCNAIANTAPGAKVRRTVIRSSPCCCACPVAWWSTDGHHENPTETNDPESLRTRCGLGRIFHRDLSPRAHAPLGGGNGRPPELHHEDSDRVRLVRAERSGEDRLLQGLLAPAGHAAAGVRLGDGSD